MTGFIVMQRDALDHPLLKDGERFRAWFWMLARAAWKPTPFDIGGKMVTLQRGQLCGSVRQFADAWGMSKSAVDRFLSRLKSETMIETETGHGRLIITICNYAKYQDVEKEERDRDRDSSGTAAGQQRDIKEQGNKGTIEDEEANASPSSARARKKSVPAHELPDGWVPQEFGPNTECRKIVDGWPPGEREIQLERFAAHHRSRGNKFKEWQDAWKTWVLNSRGFGRGNRGGGSGNYRERDNRSGFERAIDRKREARIAAERSGTGGDGGGGELAGAQHSLL